MRADFGDRRRSTASASLVMLIVRGVIEVRRHTNTAGSYHVITQGCEGVGCAWRTGDPAPPGPRLRTDPSLLSPRPWQRCSKRDSSRGEGDKTPKGRPLPGPARTRTGEGPRTTSTIGCSSPAGPVTGLPHRIRRPAQRGRPHGATEILRWCPKVSVLAFRSFRCGHGSRSTRSAASGRGSPEPTGSRSC